MAKLPAVTALDLAEYLDLAIGAEAASPLSSLKQNFAALLQVSANAETTEAAPNTGPVPLASLGASVGPLAEIAGRWPPTTQTQTGQEAASVTPGSIVTVALGTTAAQLQQLVNTVPEGTILQLQAGQYYFDNTITIARDNISIVGAGSDKTVINVPSTLGQEAFNIGDGKVSGDFTLKSTVAEGGTSMTLTGSHSFQPGDYVYLSRENTDAFYDEIGDDAWQEDSAALRTSIVQVESVDGNVITFTSGVHFDFTTGETTVSEISMSEGLAVGGFTVDYGLGTADPGKFSNTMGTYDRNAVIEVEGTAGLQLFDVASHDVPSLGVNFALSVGIAADGITMTGAHNKGDGGNGYGIQIRDVYDSSFINISDQDMRHSVVFASWRSSAGNFVHVESTDRDINFHGGRDHDNVVMVDNSIRDAQSDVISPTVFINSEGTSYGAPTDLDANTVQFGNVYGSRLNDTIEGYDTGAALDGAGGHDSLIGGDGNDKLTGGTGYDSLSGGAGVDIAVYSGSFASFTITDKGNGQIEVRDKTGVLGADQLTGMEWLQFSDGAYNLTTQTMSPLSALDDVFTGPGIWGAPDAAPVMIGTDGRDRFTVTIEGTIVHGLGEFDRVESSVSMIMSPDVERLDLVGTAAINGQGSSNADRIQGNTGANGLDGAAGDDRMWGGAGNDVITGGMGRDRLLGDAGADTINGGAGLDKMSGEEGADVFVFTSAADSAPGSGDRILDFQTGTDRIDLSAIDADTHLTGNQALVWSGTTAAAGSVWTKSGRLYADTNGDTQAELVISITGTVAQGDLIF